MKQITYYAVRIYGSINARIDRMSIPEWCLLTAVTINLFNMLFLRLIMGV